CPHKPEARQYKPEAPAREIGSTVPNRGDANSRLSSLTLRVKNERGPKAGARKKRASAGEASSPALALQAARNLTPTRLVTGRRLERYALLFLGVGSGKSR